MNLLGNDRSVVRVHAMHEAGEDDGAGSLRRILGNHDREASVFMTGLSLGPRAAVWSTLVVRRTVVRGFVACHLKTVHVLGRVRLEPPIYSRGELGVP